MKSQPKIVFLLPLMLGMLACAPFVRADSSPREVPPEKMRAIYEEVDTPFKYGPVLVPPKGEMYDNPMVFRHGDAWYMMYIRFDGKGYETHLATSDDLLTWRKLGCVFARGTSNAWDSAQADAWPMLVDTRWEGPNTLNTFQGKYWLMYLGGSKTGYETDPLSTGVAFADDPVRGPWQRYAGNPVLAPSDADAREFEKKTIYKHFTVEDPTRSCGGRFVNFYNAKSVGVWQERIGMAVSDDLCHWKRVGAGPVIDDLNPGQAGISGDPMIRRIGDVWVMFYFGHKWRNDAGAAWDTFACSYDLKHWTKWRGDPLVKPSLGWFVHFDQKMAHKPWVLKHNGVVYHFFCAEGNQGRCLALATSKDLRPSSKPASLDKRLPYADPHVLYAEGRYFAYGTHCSDVGITVSESTDLVHWKPFTGPTHGGFALYKADSFGSRWFWAPECYRTGAHYTLFYSAEGHTCVATSTSPRGPFVQAVHKPLFDDSLSIDNSFFQDDDGACYMPYVKMQNGNRIWLAAFDPKTGTVRTETRRKLLECTEPWELDKKSSIAEGPFLLKEGGKYYLTYSANDYRNPNYGIGLAIADNVWGPYVKSPANPILQNRWGLRGIGHHAFFKDAAGHWRIVFHAHNSPTEIHPRTMYIASATIANGKITFGDELITCVMDE